MAVALASTPEKTRYSIDDLERCPDDGKLRELADGQIVEWDVTSRYHGWLLMALGALVTNFVFERRLGIVVGADPLVQIQGSRYDARGPDVAFFARRQTRQDLKAAVSVDVPNFVIEVLAPSDRAVAVQQKVLDWLRAGVRLLWYVDPETGTTTVYHDGRVTGVGPDEVLNGADVLPGFSVRLRDLFDHLEAVQAPLE
jgi:Uma2 family endonuclease